MALGLVLASCGGGVASDRTTPPSERSPSDSTGVIGATDLSDVGGTAGETGSDAAIDGQPGAEVASLRGEVVRRVGAGRATMAVTRSATTLVATTTGVHVGAVATGEFAELPTELAGRVDRIAVSTDGTLLALHGDDGRLEIWSSERADAPVSTFDGVGVFALDGDRLVVASETSLEVVALGGDPLLPDAGARLEAPIGALAVAAEGRVVASFGSDESSGIVIWDGVGEARTVADPSLLGGIERIDAHPASGRAAVGVRDPADPFTSTITVLDVAVGSVAWAVELAGPASAPLWAATGDGGLVVAEETTVAIHDASGALTSRVELATTATRIEVVGDEAVVVLTDGSVVLLGADGAVEDAPDGFEAAAATDIGPSITSVSTQGAVDVLHGGETARTDRFAAGSVNDVALDDRGRLAVATTTGTVSLVASTTEAATEPALLVHPEGNVDTVAFSPDGTRLATGVGQRRAATSFDDTVSTWDLDSASRTLEVGGEAEPVAGCSFFRNAVRWAHDGSFVVATSHDSTVSVIDPADGTVRHTFEPHDDAVLDTAISPDDRLLVTSGDDSIARVWDLTTDELVVEHALPMGAWQALAFLPGGSSIVVRDLTGTMSVVDVVSGAVLSTFEGSTSRRSAIAVSPDGRLVASGGEEDEVVVWSVASGSVVSRLDGHDAPVTSVAFGADGRLASGSADGTAIVWALTG
ncbi:WD40 repeat domain-containing protein [Ilumatobacter sp.]|uniref:WD40 repeat domain-containing protein n=1 Tax=Ilumatobacter sp. TaxID=1967498 RepID=UPI003B51C7F5